MPFNDVKKVAEVFSLEEPSELCNVAIVQSLIQCKDPLCLFKVVEGSFFTAIFIKEYPDSLFAVARWRDRSLHLVLVEGSFSGF